jgi:membrane protease YdiL (CAAX protease family)
MFALTSAFGNILGTLILLVSVYVYILLVRQITARRSAAAGAAVEAVDSTRTFGLPEAVLAFVLICFLLINVVASFSRTSPVQLSDRDLVANLLFTIVIVLFVASFLKLRGLDLNSLGGFSKMSLIRAILTGAVLLLAAWPLLVVGEAIGNQIFGGSGKQGIVDLFNTSQTLRQRVMIIVLAVAVAPVCEEFIFRFFLYGTLKRYAGPALGLVLNALLFAAAHAHWPSFIPLFILGACFTLAYEWSGSILVSMTMHSLFNSITLTFLAFPGLSQQ